MKLAANSAILVGGKSTRFGSDKVFLQLGNQNVTALLYQRLSSLFHTVQVVAAIHKPLPLQNVNILYDRTPGLGPLGGLLTALENTQDDYTFILPCDLPFIQTEMIDLLWQNRNDADVIIPCHGNKTEPLSAFYHKRCIPFIKQSLREGKRNMRSFYMDLKIQKVDFEPHFRKEEIQRMFTNINFPSDHLQAEKIYKERKR
jgi:molybdopterin-guanine dinucleotide biosynthesis protein A